MRLTSYLHIPERLLHDVHFEGLDDQDLGPSGGQDAVHCAGTFLFLVSLFLLVSLVFFGITSSVSFLFYSYFF